MPQDLNPLPPGKDEIKPVHICRNVWIGSGTYIQKGVTIGEGAIIGTNSVVVTDIPPFAVAATKLPASANAGSVVTTVALNVFPQLIVPALLLFVPRLPYR